MSRYFIELSYFGTNYHGWQIQSNTRQTIQQILSDVLSVTLREEIIPVGCGRTDTGVHARQFFAHFDSENFNKHSAEFWIHKWNSMLPNDIAIHQILSVQSSAHARYSATSRTYEYHIHQKKDPFLYPYSYYFPHTLHHEKIKTVLNILSQHTDFACFTKDANEYENTNCIIFQTDWKLSNHQIIFTITANRFLRNMVRAIVGTLIWIGTDKFSLSDFENILKAKDRKTAGPSAPPYGLFLTNITYPTDIFIV